MKSKISRIFNLLQNMGPRYAGFRLKHELLRKTGLLKSKFPANPPFQQYVTFAQWRAQPQQFFFESRETIQLPREENPELLNKYNDICNGTLMLFSSLRTNLGKNYDWITNPDSGHKYDISRHWTEIADYSAVAGDIKYVWEKSRFSYLYDIIRYDYHFRKDCSARVFNDIQSWIDGNPINQGPNYRCSQEMSLRVLNWLFALYYYKNSPVLTEELFNKMQHVIYWHLHHIYQNIDFSRIAVRNNHAITETLTLYLGGLFFPSMPGAARWKQKGKDWFEEEVAYQVYKDGTFLQFSMNYHRVVVQLLTWGIVLSEKNGERFNDVVYERAKKSVQFLRTCMVDESGWLPNYGANDGALFFGLSNSHFRDYRPQLQALANALGMNAGITEGYEDAGWYGIQKSVTDYWSPANGTHSFSDGGYYLIREPEMLTFIKCGSYKDRPSQADNLHLDIWYKGENVLTDAGSYKYNTDTETIRYFSGTRSHNTVMLGDNDQMLKGGRFIWYYWTRSLAATITEDNDSFQFSGTITAFAHVSGGITHIRSISKKKGVPEWIVTDELQNATDNQPMKQLWHIPKALNHSVAMVAEDATGQELLPEKSIGWSSSLYGQKSQTNEYCYATLQRKIITHLAAGQTRKI